MVAPTTGKVFISHATDDKPLAEAVSDLIGAGIGLAHNQIFCTSLAGQGIPAGTDFKHHIQSELANAIVVIALLTPNYYASAFCLCELGATWVLSKDFLPFVTPLAGFGDLKAVLKGVQALRIDQDTDLDEMRDRLASLSHSLVPTSGWSVKKHKFLKELSTILTSLPKPATPSASDLKKVTDERDGYMEEAKSLESELKKLELKYEELGKRKDKIAIKEIDLQFSGEEEQFTILVNQAQKTVRSFSKGILEAFFYWARGAEWFPGEDWDGRLDDAIEREILKNADGEIYVNQEHPLIKPAITALSKLEKFVDKASPDFYDIYEKEYKDVLSFKSRGFWERHINL
jgi:hypothetical protein